MPIQKELSLIVFKKKISMNKQIYTFIQFIKFSKITKKKRSKNIIFGLAKFLTSTIKIIYEYFEISHLQEMGGKGGVSCI